MFENEGILHLFYGWINLCGIQNQRSQGLIPVFSIFSVCLHMGGEEVKKNRKERNKGKERKENVSRRIYFLHVWFAQEKERKINDLTYQKEFDFFFFAKKN